MWPALRRNRPSKSWWRFTNQILFFSKKGDEGKITSLLESIFPLWSFIGSDSRGRSGGLALGWNIRSIKMNSAWGCESGLGLNCFLKELSKVFSILNIYGPNLDQVPFWEFLLNKSFISNKEIIIGRDMNFSMGAAESWGPKVRSDPLSEFFPTSWIPKT